MPAMPRLAWRLCDATCVRRRLRPRPSAVAAGMKRSDWLCLVAVHSDCWLMGMTYYNAAKIDQKGRGRLLEEVNQLPTCFEIVSGRAGKAPGSGGEGADGKRVPVSGRGWMRGGAVCRRFPITPWVLGCSSWCRLAARLPRIAAGAQGGC